MLVCDSEWMDNIALNVTSFKEFFKNKGVEGCIIPRLTVSRISSTRLQVRNAPYNASPPAAVTVLYASYTEQNVMCYPRAPSATQANILFRSAQVIGTHSRSRVVLRSGVNSSAYSGLACAVAHNACSYSDTSYGARLAFRGATNRTLVTATSRRSSFFVWCRAGAHSPAAAPFNLA